jgi:hypothetical protein
MSSSLCFFSAAIILGAAAAFACSIPTFETDGCRDARYALRSFYSVHFDQGMTSEFERDAAIREHMLTQDFKKKLLNDERRLGDPFTLAESVPTTFKVGECSESGDQAVFRVQIYWRDDSSVIQKDIFAHLRNADGKWLIDDISEK